MTIKFHTDVHLGVEIKIARIRLGLKQWELAQKVGMCQNTLSLIENGRRQPAHEVLQRIEKVLNEA